jgi:hypothetical protein
LQDDDWSALRGDERTGQMKLKVAVGSELQDKCDSQPIRDSLWGSDLANHALVVVVVIF